MFLQKKIFICKICETIHGIQFMRRFTRWFARWFVRWFGRWFVSVEHLCILQDLFSEIHNLNIVDRKMHCNYFQCGVMTLWHHIETGVCVMMLWCCMETGVCKHKKDITDTSNLWLTIYFVRWFARWFTRSFLRWLLYARTAMWSVPNLQNQWESL